MPMTTNSELMELSHLDTMLARATRIDEITEVRARAEAMRTYAVHIKASQEICQEYAMARIRAERKCGQVLASLDLHGNNQHKRKSSNKMSLNDYDITASDSHIWQTIASLPDEKFENIMKERYDSKSDITTTYFYRAGKIDNKPRTTIYISTTDMARAAAVIRDNLSAEQVTQLIDELRKE